MRYYFDICDGDKWYRDEFGIELTDFSEAREQAIFLLPDIARDAAGSDDHYEVVCQVRDVTHDVVYEGELTFSGRLIKNEKQ